MDILKIKGGRPLEGKVKAAGAKNAITKLLVASLLSDKKAVFHNVPISPKSMSLSIYVEKSDRKCNGIALRAFLRSLQKN